MILRSLTSSTAVGPRRPSSPRSIGPLWTKRPSPSVRTRPVTRTGAPWLGSTLPPTSTVTVAPTPARAHAWTASASQTQATVAGRPAVGGGGGRVAGEDRDRHDPRVALHLGRAVVEPPHRAPRGQLAGDGRKEGRLPPRDRRAAPLGDDVAQPLGRLAAARVHVHVGVGLVAVEERGVAHHFGGDIRVEVERGDHGHRRPHRRPDGAQEVALAVLEPLGHHRAVQVEQHAVEAPGAAEVVEEPARGRLVEVGRHATRGRGGGREGGHEGDAARPRGLDHAAEAGARPAVRLEELAPVAEVARFELAPVGRDRAEGVRLVRKHRDEEPHGASLRAGVTIRVQVAAVNGHERRSYVPQPPRGRHRPAARTRHLGADLPRCQRDAVGRDARAALGVAGALASERAVGRVSRGRMDPDPGRRRAPREGRRLLADAAPRSPRRPDARPALCRPRHLRPAARGVSPAGSRARRNFSGWRLIRVLELTTTTAPGGGPRQVYDLARRLPRSEFEVTVAGPRDGPFFERFRALGLTAVEVPTGGPGPGALLATVRLIRKLGIEVVHTHGKGAGLHGRLAARWTGVAAVHTFHGIHYESYRRPLQPLYLGLERRLARWTHTVIHVSPTQAAEARRLRLAGSDPSVTVINGVDLDEQDRRVAASPLSRAGLGLGADWAVLGTVARFDHVKRLEALTDALQFLNRRNVAALLVGGGPPRAARRRARARQGDRRAARRSGAARPHGTGRARAGRAGVRAPADGREDGGDLPGRGGGLGPLIRLSRTVKHVTHVPSRPS